jgi:hypothetical protein
MKEVELIKFLKGQDRNHQQWLFTTTMLRQYFPEDNELAFKKSLGRFSKPSDTSPPTLTRLSRGLYANMDAHARSFKLHKLVPYLKPGALNYVSCESVLSEHSIISQQLLNHLVLMTTSTSRTFNIKGFGTIEFIHTKKPAQKILENTYLGSDGLLVATAKLAYQDLVSVNRNVHMVNKNLLKETIDEQSHEEHLE